MLILQRLDTKLTQNSKSYTKLSYNFFKKFYLSYSLQSTDYLRKCHNFIFFENKHFTLPYSSSSNIYNIVIVIMNNQFEALNAPKIDFHSSYLISYALKHLFHFLSLFIQKKKDFDSELFLKFIEPFKLKILGP